MTQLNYLRTAGIPLSVTLCRAIMLGLIKHHEPQVLDARASDGSTFICSDPFVRKFLYSHLRWVPRTSTRAAQKVPADAEQQIWELFLRLALWIRDTGVRHPSLIVNFDQTQVVMADNTSHTFDVEGTKQVAVTGKEEKRAFTSVVGVSASGELLPTQLIFKGSTDRSLPAQNAPRRSEASGLGFMFSWNPDTYSTLR